MPLTFLRCPHHSLCHWHPSCGFHSGTLGALEHCGVKGIIKRVFWASCSRGILHRFTSYKGWTLEQKNYVETLHWNTLFLTLGLEREDHGVFSALKERFPVFSVCRYIHTQSHDVPQSSTSEFCSIFREEHSLLSTGLQSRSSSIAQDHMKFRS